MDWVWLLTFAGTAGVITALLNQVFGWASGFHTRRQKAKYVALKAAIHLETFLAACEDRAADNDIYIGSRGAAGGGGWTDLPDLLPFPLGDEFWMALAPDLTERCFSVPHSLHYAKGEIAFVADQAGEGFHEEVVEAAQAKYLFLGVGAGDLAQELRRRYHWPASSTSARALTWMRESLSKIEAAQAEHLRKNAEAMALAFPPLKPTPG